MYNLPTNYMWQFARILDCPGFSIERRCAHSWATNKRTEYRKSTFEGKDEFC